MSGLHHSVALRAAENAQRVYKNKLVAAKTAYNAGPKTPARYAVYARAFQRAEDTFKRAIVHLERQQDRYAEGPKNPKTRVNPTRNKKTGRFMKRKR